MPGPKNAAKAGVAGARASAPVAAPAPDRAKLSDNQLAKAVLAKAFTPRLAEVRRLAEAVLRKAEPKAAKKSKGKGKRKKAKSGKLAKIPQKKK